MICLILIVVYSERSRGTNRIIQQGAKLVMSFDDILEDFPRLFATDNTKRDNLNNIIELSEKEKKIFEVMSYEAQHIDTICAKTQMTIEEAHFALLQLELKGLIRNLMAGYYLKF